MSVCMHLLYLPVVKRQVNLENDLGGTHRNRMTFIENSTKVSLPPDET